MAPKRGPASYKGLTIANGIGQYGECVVCLTNWLDRGLVKVQWDALHVRILHPNTNQRLREYICQERSGYKSDAESG